MNNKFDVLMEDNERVEGGMVVLELEHVANTVNYFSVQH